MTHVIRSEQGKPPEKTTPRFKAERIIIRLENSDELQTPGSWVRLVEEIDHLPDRLKEWTWEKAREMALDPASFYYLKSWSGREEVITA